MAKIKIGAVKDYAKKGLQTPMEKLELSLTV